MGGYGWDKAKETADKADAQSGSFVSLKNDGDKAVGVFLGTPYSEEAYFDKKTNTWEKYTPKHQAEGKNASARFIFNFFTFKAGDSEKLKDLNPPKVQILRANLKTYKLILKARDKYGLDKWLFEIERKGAKGDTETTYTVLPDTEISNKEKITDEQRAWIALAIEGKDEKFKHHDLEKAAIKNEDDEDDDDKSSKKKTSAKKENGAAAAANGATTPAAPTNISPEVATEFAGRLKQMPRDKIEKFCARFGVTTIKTVKAGDEAAARAFIDELEGKPPADPPTVGGEDPFG